MELDLQSLFGLHVHSCTHWLRADTPQTPAFGLIYEGAIGQPRWTTSLCDPLLGYLSSIRSGNYYYVSFSSLVLPCIKAIFHIRHLKFYLVDASLNIFNNNELYRPRYIRAI
jgi:hypothetical protein